MAKVPILRIPVPLGTTIPTQVEPPETGYPFWRFIRCGLRQRLELLIRSTAAVIAMTHYHKDAGRSVPCTHPVLGRCDWCPHWKRETGVYLAVQSQPASDTEILVMPKGSLAHCPALKTKGNLFDRKIKVEKMGFGNNAAVKAWITDEPMGILRDDLAVTPEYLQRVLWNCWRVEFAPCVEGSLK